MTYDQMAALEKGDRLQVWQEGQWKSGTFWGSVNGADPAMWFAFDERQQAPGSKTCTKIYTGMQFTPEYWNDSTRPQLFREIPEDELNEELLEKMVAAE